MHVVISFFMSVAVISCFAGDSLQYNGLNNSNNSSIGTMNVNNYFGPGGNGGNGENIIANPVITDWGFWGNWENCSSGHYAIGFQLKSQIPQRIGDDTALNGIKLLCGKPGSLYAFEYPTSKVGDYGSWGKVFYCYGSLLTGFILRSEPPLGGLKSQDDTAANDMKGICTSPSAGETKIIEGDGLEWGDWTADQRCDPGKAICGIVTQVEANTPIGVDNTALNNVRMKCCDIKM